MSQHQAALPFKPQSDLSFEKYMDNGSVVEAMKKLESLPQFIYVWGAEYSGKTHLFNAFEVYLNELKSGDVCFAVDAIYLTQIELVQVFPKGLNYLLLDDVHIIAGDALAEVALFNLFNYCKTKDITLMTFASIHSKANQWQLPDLISRLNSGLNLKLEALRGESAFSCMVKQFKINGIPLDCSVIQYLQTHYSSNYTDLYRLFLLVLNESLKLKRKVTVPLVKQIMQQLESVDV